MAIGMTCPNRGPLPADFPADRPAPAPWNGCAGCPHAAPPPIRSVPVKSDNPYSDDYGSENGWPVVLDGGPGAPTWCRHPWREFSETGLPHAGFLYGASTGMQRIVQVVAGVIAIGILLGVIGGVIWGGWQVAVWLADLG